MDRLKKLIWMICVLWIVFFIICDEKWYKIQWQDNHIVLNKTEKKSEIKPDFVVIEKRQVSSNNAVYKNSSLIHINYEFENPRTLRNVANKNSKKKTTIYKNSSRIKIYSWFENPITLRKSIGSDATISNVFQWWEDVERIIDDYQDDIQPKILYKNSNRIKIYSWFENPTNMRRSAGIEEEILINSNDLNDNSVDNSIEEYQWNIDSLEKTDNTVIEMKRYEYMTHDIEMKNWTKVELDEPEITPSVKLDKYEYMTHDIEMKNWTKVELEEREQEIVQPERLDKYEYMTHDIEMKNWTKVELDEWEQEVKPSIKLTKYQLNTHSLMLKKWVVIEHNFAVEDTQNIWTWIPDSILQDLLENEEIDIDTLESENDEFLQKVFEKTRDTDVMNLIVENYLNEYQFIKAKNFIENLPETYRNDLKPLLNLRVAFNSFPLTSKTVNESLTALVQDYASKNVILDDNKNRYLWVIALIDRNYDKFFEISKWFTSEKYKAFTAKLQWYKDQIAKQMWMPDYYFDTLVSLELFNQWLFQPAKVLALYSLQQNLNYILPYQVLAYANFLTNSRDTSIEYLKKLEDLDPNNAEKYRFLMWVAFYRNEKYEQSVVMLSMIKDESLRLDTQRYLINDYLKLDQKNKLISSWNKLLWYENLVASDFYTYFYETFFHPYSQWEEFQLYAFDTELANKMLRICSTTLQNEEKAVCTYWTIGRNIALWQFDGMEQYLLDLVAEYPQWYLYQALWEYYIKQRKMDKAKAYLLKAVSLSQNKSEKTQIKKLLEDAM